MATKQEVRVRCAACLVGDCTDCEVQVFQRYGMPSEPIIQKVACECNCRADEGSVRR